ncbi:MAG: TorF family putative porin, partial [Thermoanaerobaculia bacterium]|nr:TorF family putative porin [Thermoanaerobaculia bacterium]
FATVSTDYVFRGVSQTIEDPAVQAGLAFEHASGWFAGVWASTVDFPTNAVRDRPRDLEIDLWLGYGIELTPRWGLALEARQYEYPDDDPAHDYDYTELSLVARRARSGLSVSYAEEALGVDASGLAVEASHRLDLPRRIDLLAGVGYYDLGGPFLEDYLFWSLIAGRTVGRLRFELGYFGTDDRGRRVFGDLAGSRLVASLSLRFL